MIDNSGLLKLRELLAKEEQITILVRRNPDLDTMAASLSLSLSLGKAGKRTSIACPTEPIVEIASLVGIDKVTRELPRAGGDLTIVLPYEQGSIDKISYNIEGDKIHLVVKKGPDGLGFEPSDIQFLQSGGSLSGIVFLVGVRDLKEDVGSLVREEELSASRVVVVGNTQPNGQYGEVQCIDGEASSVSEVVAHILEQIEAPVDVDIGQNLLNGITFATDNFQSKKTSPLSFEMAAFLLRCGATRQGEEKMVSVDKGKAPLDWLTPKIYKGSTLA